MTYWKNCTYLAMALMVPMCTRDRELEPDNRILRIMHFNVLHRRLHSPPVDSMIALRVAINLYPFTRIIQTILFPGKDSAVFAEQVVFILRIMCSAKVDITSGKFGWAKVSVVYIARASKTTSTPASINQLPLPIVDSNSVPCVVRAEGWDGIAKLEGCVAEAFAGSTDHNGF